MKSSLLLFLILLCNYSVNANDWFYSLDEGRLQSFSENKLMLVYYCSSCKEEDNRIWEEKEIRNLRKNYISVRINLREVRDFKLKYEIEKVPGMLLLDGLGNLIYRSSRYINVLEVENVLSSFKSNINHLNQVIGHHVNNEDDPMRNLMLAKGYQKYISESKDWVQSGFLKNSIVYFNRAKKTARKNKNLLHSIELSKIYNDILLNKPKKVIQKTSKLIEQERLTKKNLSLAYYTIIKGFRMIGDTISEKKYLEKLEKLPQGKVYLNQLVKS